MQKYKTLLRTTAVLAVAGVIAGGCMRIGPLEKDRPGTVPAASISTCSEKAWRQFKAGSESSGQPLTATGMTHILNRILQAAGRVGIQSDIYIYKGKTANAFLLPPARIAVHEDICKVLKTDDERAALLAHLLGHADAVHGTARLGVLLRDSNVEEGIENCRSGKLKNLVQLAFAGFAPGLEPLPFSEKQEMVADSLAAVYLARAGYRADALLSAWDKMGGPSAPAPAFLRLHPMSARRRGKMEKVFGDNPSLR